MAAAAAGPASAFESSTFDRTLSIAVDDEIGAASISPAGRDVVLASKSGLRIIDLDNPYSLPLFLPNQSSWHVADVQWSPFAARAEWIASTRNQLALVYNLSMPYNSKKAPIEYTLRAHDRAITDINFSAHHPDLLATCGVDSFVFVHDLRSRQTPLKLADFTAGATQVKWNRQNDKIIASAHDKYLHIWDTRRGATPLSTIVAHSTKIYGIDWNRNDSKKIMTCSLDATIKLWNNVGVTTGITTPRRVIRTHYPVWRARHCPFPHGILAMPQRGNSGLWLYKHVNDSKEETFSKGPAHNFQGHEPDAQVREFLWRTRGSTEYGIDDRDFQLVSWGTDKHLHLHRLSPELLDSTVGFRKGEALVEEPSRTRKGATYMTYRDGPVSTTVAAARTEFEPRNPRKGNLSTLLQNYPHNDEANPSRASGPAQGQVLVDAFPRETMTAQRIRRNDPRVVTHITWMDGVKFGDRPSDVNEFRPRSKERSRGEKNPYQEQNDLGAEISLVGNKYKRLSFEQIDVPGRRITVSFNGPWGEYDMTTEDFKLVFLRFTVKFPAKYPKVIENALPGQLPTATLNPLEIEFEKTTASISKEKQDELIYNMKLIAEACSEQEREALEAVLSYALGDRGLNDSLHLAGENQPLDDLDPLPEGESSSEDDEHEGEFADDAMQSSHTNANVPLGIQCTVRFSVNGSLVVARIPTTKSVLGTDSIQFRITRNLRHGIARDDIFDSFGRLTSERVDESDGGSSPTSSSGSWEASSSPSSSSGSDHGNAHIGNFAPPLAWQKTTSRFQSRNSLPSSTGAPRPLVKTKPVISILSQAVDDLLPSKKILAEEYRIFGSGPDICEHNSQVAKKHGFDDLADIWLLCKLILNNDVPLSILPQTHRRDQVLVLARRALVRIKRKDSGLDLQFDEADTVTNPKLQGRIKWGNHTVVTWLIPALFDYFEHLADTQMLAMLSCIFAEPAAREGVTSAMAKLRQSQLPMSMEAPAFSLDYFSSPDAAWSLFRPTISVPSTPAHSRFANPNDFGWQRLAKNVGTYGSHGSSNGPWGSDTVISEPVTPYSTDNTPPTLSRASTMRSAHTTNHTPYSTSPEQSHTALKKSSTANFASAVAALSRPFANAIAASPPVKSQANDLSTSAPTGGVTWGTTTFYDNDSQDRRSLAPSRSKHGKRASFGQAEHIDVDYIYDSDSDYDKINDDYSTAYDGASEYTVPSTPRDDGEALASTIKVTLKNQDQFDDEACVSRPLLDMSKDWLHRAWREQYAEMLGCWGLVCQRAEILKFNGLVSYFPPDIPRSGSRAGSMYLALKERGEADKAEPAPRHLSRASTTLEPPPSTTTQRKRSPAVSPRHFSFNPEALEFQPGTGALSPTEEFAPPPDVFISSEQYLQLSIPVPTPSRELDENLGGLGSSPGQSKLHPPYGRVTRPSLSRGASNVSGSSSWGGGRLSAVVPTSAAPKAAPHEPIYSCSICWIRVSGRFYLCPACGHVAHFDCMDDDLGTDDGECVVGCGCGCGLEDDDERSRMEAYIDEVRAANAAGVAWEEGSDWHQTVPRSQPVTPGLYADSIYGDFMTGGASKMAISNGREKKKKEKLSAGGRSTASTSPSSTTKKKDQSKSKKKTRASGLSYY